MGEFLSVFLVLKYRKDDLLQPGTEMIWTTSFNLYLCLNTEWLYLTEYIGMNIATGEKVQQGLVVVLGQRARTFLHKVDTLAVQIAGPVCVDLWTDRTLSSPTKVSPYLDDSTNWLRDDQFLDKIWMEAQVNQKRDTRQLRRPVDTNFIKKFLCSSEAQSLDHLSTLSLNVFKV